jgi:hypothetical protein
MKTISTKKKKRTIRADLLWKELLESFLYFALEIFYPSLYEALDYEWPPVSSMIDWMGSIRGGFSINLHAAFRKEEIIAFIPSATSLRAV